MILLVAVGNLCRGDDGVAHRVLELVAGTQGVSRISCHQLTPELAEDIAAADDVYFIDADPHASEAGIEPLQPLSGSAATTAHAMTPASLAALAKQLYGWRGRAFLCRTPAMDFSPGMRLSGPAEAAAQAAAKLLTHRLSEKP